MTQWERAVEAAARALYDRMMHDERFPAWWDKLPETEKNIWCREAAAALRAALPALFEGRDGRNTFILAEHRRALEAEASHEWVRDR